MPACRTRVVQHADDPRRPLVARRLQPELLDEREIARGSRHRSGPRVRDVGEERSERDDELDAELAGEADDELVERAPPVVRLDAEQDHRIAVGARDRGGVEHGLGPLDLPRQSFVERDGRSRGLEVDEPLRVDLGEPPRIPGAHERAAGERRSLAAVVPAAEGGDQNGAPRASAARRSGARSPSDGSLAACRPRRGARAAGAAPTRCRRSATQIVAASETWIATSHHGSAFRYWISPTAICTSRRRAGALRLRAIPGSSRRSRQRKTPTTRSTIP